MDDHLKHYFHQTSDEGPRGNYHSVIALHEAQDMSWHEIQTRVPSIPKGWYELAHLPSKDRVEFSHDFWLSKLPYRTGVDKFLDRFFASLEDVSVLITQKKFDDPYEASLVYCLKEYSGFFRGSPPVDAAGLDEVEKLFSPYLPPNDYIAFLHIHDGFSKATDCTGITPTKLLQQKYQAFQQMLQEQEPMITSIDTTVAPKSLFPFYESFGMPFYQCFWAEWYPEQEMGNVYYSTESKAISDPFSSGISSEAMAFPTFVDWLIFYLERVV